MNSRVVNETGNRDDKHSTLETFCIVKSFLNGLDKISEFGQFKPTRCEKISIIVKGNRPVSVMELLFWFNSSVNIKAIRCIVEFFYHSRFRGRSIISIAFLIGSTWLFFKTVIINNKLKMYQVLNWNICSLLTSIYLYNNQ